MILAASRQRGVGHSWRSGQGGGRSIAGVGQIFNDNQKTTSGRRSEQVGEASAGAWVGGKRSGAGSNTNILIPNPAFSPSGYVNVSGKSENTGRNTEHERND